MNVTTPEALRLALKSIRQRPTPLNDVRAERVEVEQALTSLLAGWHEREERAVCSWLRLGWN